MKITLRDIDNRDDAGAPFEFTGDVDSVVRYLDGAVRSDLTDGATAGADLDEAIALLRGGSVEMASGLLRPMSVYLTIHPTGSE